MAQNDANKAASGRYAALRGFHTPPDSCDCHLHIFSNRFPVRMGPAPDDRTAAMYQQARQRTGTTRAVVVSPRSYATDHACTLDAIARLGPSCTRGIAVVHPTVSDAELRRLADGGVRGIRFTVEARGGAVTTVDMIEPLSRRIEALGWHVQLHMLADEIADNADMLLRLPSPIVFDHMARLPPGVGIRHPAYAVVRSLLDRGHTWIKLSPTTFPGSSQGSLTRDDMIAFARAWIEVAPERVVWGSDWPHRSEKQMPDEAELFDLLTQYAQNESTLRRILVDNPQTLYGFPATSA